MSEIDAPDAAGAPEPAAAGGMEIGVYTFGELNSDPHTGQTPSAQQRLAIIALQADHHELARPEAEAGRPRDAEAEKMLVPMPHRQHGFHGKRAGRFQCRLFDRHVVQTFSPARFRATVARQERQLRQLRNRRCSANAPWGVPRQGEKNLSGRKLMAIRLGSGPRAKGRHCPASGNTAGRIAGSRPKQCTIGGRARTVPHPLAEGR